MSQGGSNNRIAGNLVSASCAAILAVYSAGYLRTQAAADRVARQVAQRRAIHEPIAAAPRFSYQAPVAAAAVEPPPQPAAKVEHPKKPKVEQVPETPAVEAVQPEPAPPVADVKPEPAPAATLIAAPVPPPPPPAPPAPQWKDGVYTGWGYSRHGNIEAQVTIEGGRIASAVISQCRTRYSCSVIDRLPPEVAQRQSPEVDYVSGATQSADAFYGAVVEALGKAR